MNKLFCIIIFIFCGVCRGQNLVPNGDFESFSGCPQTGSQIDSTINWHSANTATPDYFNVCSTSLLVGVPVNWNNNGYQKPRSGEGYVGIYTLQYAGNQKEFIETALSAPLIASTTYYFSMYVNLLNYCKYTTHNMGAYFSDTAVHTANTQILPVTPQIVNAANNTFDTLAWTLVSGSYTAHGGEQFLILGNFDPDTLTDTIYYQNAPFIGLYLYIDDVCVSTDSLTCNSPAGINQAKNGDEFVLFPNPFSDKINITAKRNTGLEITLFDITSRKIIHQSFRNSISINTTQLAKGIYTYEVIDENGAIRKGKVIKE